MCQKESNKKEFEFLPHQLFVRNFLSQQTPYNSILLYHSVGTGKTLTAISIAEDMRSYLKQLGIRQKIFIVGSPNVQKNFEKQFFDETKLIDESAKKNKISNEKRWSIRSGIANTLLQEISPNINDDKEDIVNKIRKLRNKYYQFYGYGELGNLIEGFKENGTFTKLSKKKIANKFNNALIVIDEVHNIRTQYSHNEDGEENIKKVKTSGKNILKIAEYTENVRFVLLSATPIYNSYDEIIFLTNLMNINDKRKGIKTSDVFDKEGNFKTHSSNNIQIENGENLLIRKLTGYVSFVRGENPYNFPYRIYPRDIPSLKQHSVLNLSYPSLQLNGNPLDNTKNEGHIQHLDLFITNLTETQQKIYEQLIGVYIKKNNEHKTKETIEDEEEDLDEEIELNDSSTFSYNLLQKPLQALNIVFPNSLEPETSIGKRGLENIMEINEEKDSIQFKYKTNKYGRIFSLNEIGKYSSKIHSICNMIKQSNGIVLIYAYYIWGGIIPLALALEEMGFSRHSSNSKYKNLLEESSSVKKNGQKYLMITGNTKLSSDNADDVKYVSREDNKNGKNVKVILISTSGSEGLDFKNIRQIHIMDSWYTMNRIEQIIGRGVRTLSHCNLPVEERSVEIYLHATMNDKEETADLYMYRYAEKKAVKLGKIYRMMKEISIDCMLNQGQKKMSTIDLNQTMELVLSNGEKIKYDVGDKPFSSICDYTEDCHYQCFPKDQLPKNHPTNNHTYNNDFMKNNNSILVEKIKTLFRDKEKFAYHMDEIIFALNYSRSYPMEQIYYALSHLIQNKNEYIVDFYGRIGNLINKENYYVFQPTEITDEQATLFERSHPVPYKQQLIRIPDEYKHAPMLIELPSISQENDVDVVDLIRQKYSVVFGLETTSFKATDWFYKLRTIKPLLMDEYHIEKSEIERYLIHHLLDTFSLSQKLSVLRENPDIQKEHIASYFEGKTVGNFMLLYDLESNTNKYFKMSKAKESVWEETEKVLFEMKLKDDTDIERTYKAKFLPRLFLKDGEYIGFMSVFGKTTEIVFKVKTTKGSGVYLANGNKNSALQIVNSYVNKKEMNRDELTKLGKNELSVFLEIAMRHDGKFRNPEQYEELNKSS